MHIVNRSLRIALFVKLAIKTTDNSDMYSREFPVGNALFFFISAQPCRRSHAVCGGGGTDPENVAGTALQRWHGVFRGGLQRDDGAGRGTGVMVGGRKRNFFQNLRKFLNFLTEETAGRIILAEGPLRSGFL